MNKYLLTLFMVCISVLYSKAQNWQTVPANDTNWFVINNTPNNQSGRLRVAWLDSSQTVGSISTNYFYPALRMNSTGCLDTAGASWLGKKYTRNQITGEEYYFNFIGDTLTIKTWSQLGETWLMTTDTNSVAFQAAQKYYSATLDLYMKDCPYDLGGTGVDYACTTVADNSPDVWMRYYQDGIGTNGEINDEHEYVQYYGPNQAPNYVYVRIRNKSCVASNGNELLKVYWSKAATWGSWPHNWDGTIPTLGNSIATVTLPILQPGEVKVIEIPWVVDANVGVNGPVNTSTIVNYCILARIESLNDPISAANPNNLVESNNNIAIRNTFLWDLNSIGGSGPILGTSLNDGFDYPLGSFVAVENPLNNETVFDFHFKTPTPNNGNKITDDAEIILVLQQEMFDAIQNAGGFTQQGVQVIQNREVKITKDSIVFENVLIPENTRWINFIGVRYLIDSVSSPKQYTYLMAQSFPDSALYLGGENIIIRRNMRTQFNASAGPDVSIFAGDSVTISASGIGEPAKYQWFDVNNNLLHNTQSFTTSVNNQTTFKLRVTSQLDGSVDYDAMNVFIKNGNISTYYPNPITNNLTVDYTLEHVNTASLVLLSPFSNIYASFPLNINSYSTILDFSNYPSGFYSLLLMCDGNIQDSKSIQKQ